MPVFMEANKLWYPHDIGFFCSDAILFQANNITDLIQQFSLVICHGLW